MKAGLLIIATNRYNCFLSNLISSADSFFLKNHEVTYFVFSNFPKETLNLNSKRKINVINIEHKNWPFMTLERYKIFNQNSKEFEEMDYLYYCDVDMLFVSEVGDEVLSDRVATTHPGFMGGRGTPETRKESLAYVAPHELMIYFAGGFNGGKKEIFLEMSKILSENIKKDFENGIIAIWHDESHMNRYFIDNPPTLILTPSYCYPESWNIPFQKKLLALDKNHKELRS